VRCAVLVHWERESGRLARSCSSTVYTAGTRAGSVSYQHTWESMQPWRGGCGRQGPGDERMHHGPLRAGGPPGTLKATQAGRGVLLSGRRQPFVRSAWAADAGA
jgi:hypothetical protein